jgi:hypothetical protein
VGLHEGELQQMERQGSGAIVNNASVGALTGNPGIRLKARGGRPDAEAALEYIKRGIRVNAVNPGLIDTQIARDVVNADEQTYADLAKDVPIGRAGRPEEVGRAVALQSGSKLRSRPRPHCGWRDDSGVSRHDGLAVSMMECPSGEGIMRAVWFLVVVFAMPLLNVPGSVNVKIELTMKTNP